MRVGDVTAGLRNWARWHLSATPVRSQPATDRRTRDSYEAGARRTEGGRSPTLRPGVASDTYIIDRTVTAGDVVDIPLSPRRSGQAIEVIDLAWHGEYRHPDPSGRLSTEGTPFYLDGVYAQAYLVDARGREHKIDAENFVDAHEEDNLHHLSRLWHRTRGELLRVRFSAKHPLGQNHPVKLEQVRVRYRAAGGETSVKIPVGRIIEPNESLPIDVPAQYRDRPISRINVRWTDMLSGTWTQTGHASGQLTHGGRPIGRRESVQSPETQAFDPLGGITAKDGALALRIDTDPARVDWVEVFFDAAQS